MPASRPEKPIDAVRELFASNRMQAAWNMLSRATTEVETISTLGAVVRMLGAKGLHLADVAEAVSAPAARPASAKVDSPFSDIFSHMRSRTAAANGAGKPNGTQKTDVPPPHATGRPRPSTILQGAAVPGRIYGRISIHDERPTRNGRMLIIGVVGRDAVYDPIVCFDEKLIDGIRIASRLDQVISLRIRKPSSARRMPCAIAID